MQPNHRARELAGPPSRHVHCDANSSPHDAAHRQAHAAPFWLHSDGSLVGDARTSSKVNPARQPGQAWYPRDAAANRRHGKRAGRAVLIAVSRVRVGFPASDRDDDAGACGEESDDSDGGSHTADRVGGSARPQHLSFAGMQCSAPQSAARAVKFRGRNRLPGGHPPRLQSLAAAGFRGESQVLGADRT